ncbi:restriction endonuclease [Algoriphagus pacificus]|uniref:Restriction endonuclease n=1 Tax=Algoriphagus pacificus TaxID=2811234 RepID=A0ABS3CF81_9BACT|nr:restriction endonuclease [Algoriphagus pacificus]MBN7815174.1 restriction endonuclease [Algoriphagus pacificus]
MAITGSDFEKLVKPFFKNIFEEMGFLILQVRKQDSGDQNGFDISVLFLDDDEQEREFFIECKYYTTAKLDWADIFNKQLQLEASSHNPTAFIALSPLRDLSNIDHNIQSKVIRQFKYPVDFWTPDKEIEKLFALDTEVYKKVFDKPTYEIPFDRETEIKRIKAIINNLIQKKEALRFADIISIQDTDIAPDETPSLKTTLDEKLNSILSEDDEHRIRYHRIRANYKVYVDSLNDLNPSLRTNILNWESNLRLKADRLTNNFNIDTTYTPHRFFHDFFNEAEKEILTFYKDFELKGDKEKLLQGVVFELAAQCPLDWRKNGTV